MKNKPLLSTGRQKILLILVILLVFGNTVFNEYSLDDNLDIYENVNVQKGIAGIPGIFTSPFVQREEFNFDYRPVSPLTFCIEKSIWGFSPHLSHLVNLLLYMLAVLLLFQFLQKLYGKKENTVYIFIALLIFSVHPLHTEVVASLKNRQELLSLIFGTLCLSRAYDFIVNSSRYRHAFLSFIFLMLSYLTKLTSLPFLGYIFLMSWFFYKKNSWKEIVAFNFFLFISTIIYILSVKDWLFRPYYFSENPLVAFGLSEKLGTTVVIFLYYLKLLLLPWPMSFYYGYNTINIVPVFNLWAIGGLMFFIIVIMVAFRYYRRKNVLALTALFFFGGLAIYNNVFSYYPGLLSDRAMFMPGLWFILFWVMLYEQNHKAISPALKKYSYYAAGALVIVFSLLSVVRNRQWRTTISLMEADIGHLQHSVLANYYYGWTLYAETRLMPEGNDKYQNIQKIKKLYSRAIELNPQMLDAHYNLGLAYKYLENNNDSATQYFREEAALDSSRFKVNFELGKCYLDGGRFNEAATYLRTAHRQKPGEILGLFYLAEAEYLEGNKLEANRLNDQLQQMAPQTQYPYLNRGTFLQQAGQTDSAMAEFDKAVRMGCNDRRLFEALYNYYNSRQITDKAGYYYSLLNNNR